MRGKFNDAYAIFSSDFFFLIKAYVVGTHLNCLDLSFFLIFQEDMAWHFMRIICFADNSNKMSRPAFLEKWKTYI